MRGATAADWQGDIALPAELERFYREVGPLDCTLESAGNPFFLPSLARLWQRQAGYRWHGISGERLSGWQDDWLVVADQGADPFILETGSGRILFDLHGGRGWDPAPCFDDLWQMAASLACFGEVWSGAGEDILLDDCSVAPAIGSSSSTNCNRSSVRASGRRTSPTSSAGKLVATPPPPMTCA